MTDHTNKMAYSVEEAALQTNLGRDKLYAEIRAGRILARKAGRRTLIPADALKRYIDNLPTLQLAAGAE